VDDLVIETVGLRKQFRGRRGRKVPAVHDLDLRVPAGGVHALLGPNGSGKTTTIRMLLGLARPSAGEIRLFGEPVPRRLPRVMPRIGAVVDHPRFVPGFSGRRNLSLLADSAGLPDSRVDAVLERVDLGGRERDTFRTYSPGTRQRLAVAGALLKQPELVVLDEPTNGLDAAGARDLRRLVRDLARSGVTVLLSSHILAEVQQVCDSVSILGDGTVLSSGTVEELVGREQARGVRVGVPDPIAAMDVLREAGLDVARDGSHLYVAHVAEPAEITRLLAARDIWVGELVPDADDLEAVYLRTLDDHAGSDRGDAPREGGR
jgi:ABC-2 type transport system ATP-binding protein